MCIGYDPFKWADSYDNEKEYFDDLIIESEVKNDNRINENRKGHTEFTSHYGKQ